MPRIMKSPTAKQMIARINGKTYQISVDSSIFDDVYVEAVTRVVENHKKDITFFHKMKVIAECYEKKDAKDVSKHVTVNMYHILLNAGMYSLSELLRTKTKNLHKIDLQLEPIRTNAGR